MRRPDAPIREAMRRPATLVFSLALCAPAAMAQPAIERGRALYETRCIACHEKSVHQRESRKAQDFATLRREVERWSTNIGGEWRAEELDAVAVFLNDRYYRFTCPPAVCREPSRADGASRHGG
jgi:mono/diheme cytochrome c family protein